MKLKLFPVLFIKLYLCCFIVEAQTGNANYFMPRVVPSAPNTAAIAKFGSYPVNMYSGVPDISIPLYTVESGGLQVPVTLSYHASGIRVTDAASWVGLGWSLSCGGAITRKVFGLPDEIGYLIETKRYYNLQNNNDLDYVKQTVEDRIHDNMPDIYSYQIPGYSGKFFYDADSSFKIMIVPRSPLSVTSTHTYNNQKFAIADEHGNTYRLGNTYQEQTYANFYTQNQTSAWMLESMISQNKRDTISFTYSSHIYQLPDGTTETITVEDELSYIDQRGQGYTANTAPTKLLLNNPATVTEQQLNTVYFKNGKIVFVTGGTRRDINSPALDTMKVYKYNFAEKKYDVQKSIVFVKSYFGTDAAGNLRLRLDGIKELDKANGVVNQYYFSYNPTVVLPPYGSLARDYWGYYNGKDNSTDLIPQTTIQMISFGGGLYNLNIGNTNDPTSSCRNIDSTKMQANILTSIKYPTGGHTDFTYQTNRYLDGNNHTQLAGGLRVTSIASYSGDNPIPIVKTFSYNVAQPNFVADPLINLNVGLFTNTQTYRNWTNLSGTDPGEIGGYAMTATKRVRRFYAEPNVDLNLDGVPVAYTTVTEYIGSPDANIGKSIYTFSWSKSSLQAGGGETGQQLLYDYSFSNGKILSKTDFMRKTDGSYQIVKSVVNHYGAWPGFYYPSVGNAYGQFLYNDGALAPGAAAYFQQENPDDEQTYPRGDFVVQSGDTYLTSSITTLFDKADTTKYVTSSVSYKYGDLTHQQILTTTHVDSKGNTRVTNNKYAFNYPAGNPVIDSMVNRHMWGDPLEKSETYQIGAAAAQTTAAQLHQFKFGYIANTIVPDKVSVLNLVGPVSDFTASTVASGALTKDSRYTQMISFDAYDKYNNLTQYTPRNTTPVAATWDYQGELPVAQIKNAAQSDVSYTSFEGDGKGGFTYNGPTVTDPTAPAGSRVYNLAGGSIFAPINVTRAYVLSLWSNNGAPAVSTGSSFTGTPLRTAGGWTYYEYALPSGSSGVSISGTTTIDELRLYPADAQMTTYAYSTDGVTDIADTKGSISHFDYDAFSRLKNTKDWAGNIVKNYSYHTYDQVYGNAAQGPTTYTRNNCPAGTSPGSTTYSVPANKYYGATTADANAEAVYDRDINGQIKANTVCGCPINYISYTLTNLSGHPGFQVTFSGIATPFNFPTSGSTTINVPLGTYATVSIAPNGSFSQTFTMGTRTPVTGHSASFSNITVATGSSDLNLTIN